MKTTLNEIETATRKYADARTELTLCVEDLNQKLEELKRKHLAEIRLWVGRCAERESALGALIQANPGLFEQPRTHIFHGVKVGFAKGGGAIEFDDEARVIKLIREKLPEDVHKVLIKTTEKVVKKPLRALTVHELKLIGCTVVESGDHVVIAATDKEVDKLVSALLDDAVKAAKEEEE